MIVTIPVMYAVSFFLPAFDTGKEFDSIVVDGYWCFRATLGTPAWYVTWAANPALWIAWIQYCRRRWFSASALGLASLCWGTYQTVWVFFEINACASGLMIGYWLWIGCMLALTIGSMALLLCTSGTPKQHARLCRLGG